MHNCEIDLGAANALCLKLGYILLQKNNALEVYTEIEMVCASLQMVYRCSVDRRIHSFRDIGYTELLPLLVQVLNVTVLQSGSQSHAILQTLHVLRVFCKLDLAKHHLVHYQSLWSALVELIWSLESVGENLIEKDADEVQLGVLVVVKDLTFRTSDEDKMAVYGVKGLVPTLLHIGRKTSAHRQREGVAAIWWNLAMSSNVGREMTGHSEVLTSLHGLILPEDTVKTRRNAISSVGNLATVADNHERLLSHQDGILIQRIMTAAHDEDTDIRRRSMRTLRCLCSGEAAHALRRQGNFCDFLASVAQHDLDRDTRIQALECMTYVAADREAMTEVGPGITMALIRTIENSNEFRLTATACRSLSLCLSNSDSTLVGLSASFYSALTTAVAESSDADSHCNVSSVLLRIAETDGFADKVPTCALLNLLSALISQKGPDLEQSRTIAMSAITALADNDGNKRAMAEDEGLLTALVNYAMTTDESKKKDEAKVLILKLIPEL
jgi:hypothetical protein